MMNPTGKNLFKRYVAILSLALFTSQTTASLTGGLPAAWAAVGTPVSDSGINERALLKTGVAQSETDSETGFMRKSNVLFMIDTSQSTMIFTSWGVQPWVVDRAGYSNTTDRADWNRTEATFGYTFKDVVDMMADCTYGIGMLPSVQTGTNRTEKNILFGRDVDDRNNYTTRAPGGVAADIEKYKNDYHFPFTSTTNPLDAAFQSQRTEYVTNGAQGDAGTSQTSNAYQNLPANAAFPYALVFRNPAYWQTGWTGSRNPTRTDLVPNDSRMYKTKLVLWRLLEDTKLFENIRFGMASIFANMEQTNLASLNHFKHAPFTSGAQGDAAVARSATTNNPNNRTPANYNGYYINGVLQRDATGQPGSGHDGRDTVQASSWTTGNTSAITRPDNAQHIEMNRAHLKLPIADYAKIWETGSGNSRRTITHADKFRLWINGLNDVAAGDFYTHKDPELIPSGNFQLASAMFQNPTITAGQPTGYDMRRETYINRGLLWYADSGTGNAPNKQGVAYGGMTFNTTTHRYKRGSGEAAGAVLDFFSPPVTNTTFRNRYGGTNVPNMDDISFPIRDVCEDNWVVLLTSGIEVKTYDRTYVYKIRDSIRDLYNHTANNNVTRMYYEGNTRRFEQTKLNNPVRTLVVGMVGEERADQSASMNQQIRELRDNLWKMAWAGQGLLEGMTQAQIDGMSQAQMEQLRNDHPDVKPLFASNVDELLEALRTALTYINDNQQQPASGSMTESAALGGDLENPTGEDLNFFASTYRVRNSNQWEATLTRYATKKEADGSITAKKVWEFSDELEKLRGNRSIYYVTNNETRGKIEKITKNDFRGDFLAGLTGADGVTGTTASGVSISTGENDPPGALYEWLQGYDYSYGDKRKYERRSMLSDFGQAGVAFVDKPLPTYSLPGYREWALGEQRTEPMLYAQTNDGILHVIDPDNGAEKMAILPPPVLIPSRLATLKTSPYRPEQWMEVEGPDVDINDSANQDEYRSRSAYLLDGALQARRFNLSRSSRANDWGTYLVGALGRAGSGLYMMDISDVDISSAGVGGGDSEPKLKFMWYWEKLVDKLGNKHLLYMNNSIGMREPDVYGETDPLPGGTNSLNHAYRKLGFNSPKPAMGVAGDYEAKDFINFIALAGGVRSKSTIDAANRQEGAVLLILDPASGDVLKVFDNELLANEVDSRWRVPTTIAGLSGTDYMGMMVSEPTLYRSDQSSYLAGQIFAADGRGNIFRIYCEGREEDGTMVPLDDADDWTIETVATLQNGTGGNNRNYAVPHGVVLGIANRSLWVAGGTANIHTVRSNPGDSGIIENYGQMIFALNPAAAKTDGTLYRSNWMSVDADSDEYLAPGGSGWYIELDAPEYVSAKPLVIDGTLYIATFREDNRPDINDPSRKCVSKNIRGMSRLFAVDISNAKANTWKEDGKMVKYIEFPDVKITGLTYSGRSGRLFVTADNFGDMNKPPVPWQEPPIPTHAAMAIMLPSDGQPVINYWLGQ